MPVAERYARMTPEQREAQRGSNRAYMQRHRDANPLLHVQRKTMQRARAQLRRSRQRAEEAISA